MPSIKEEILISLYEGLFYLLNPYEFCCGNQQYHTNSFYKAMARLEKNVFDVPEKQAQARKYLRNYLKSLGFGKVQRSIWITPYDFGKLINHFSLKMKIFDCIYQMTVEQFRGLTGVELAQIFWPIKTINSEYQNLIKIHSDRLKRLQLNKNLPDPSKSNLGKQFLNSLLWDYQSIAARDPHLPPQLLPSEWSQKNALAFIEKIKKTFKLVDH